jgi:putative flippase GtrA
MRNILPPLLHGGINQTSHTKPKVLVDTLILLKFIRFGLVGASGVLLDYGMTALAKEWLKLNKYIANSIGFVTAATSNYVINRIWTFHSHNPHISLEFTEFFLISLIGLGLSNTIIWYVSKKTTFNFYLIKGVATCIVFLWNFGANNWITFQ